jgi:hypothetical protein
MGALKRNDSNCDVIDAYSRSQLHSKSVARKFYRLVNDRMQSELAATYQGTDVFGLDFSGVRRPPATVLRGLPPLSLPMDSQARVLDFSESADSESSDSP